jgi:hypothetical protein
VSFSGVHIFRFGRAVKVVEIWNHRDDLGLMEQLGTSVFAGAVPSGACDATVYSRQNRPVLADVSTRIGTCPTSGSS